MNRLFFRNFLGPWVATLIIALFILVMKSMGLWLDDLAGSGSLIIVGKIAFWASLMLLPGALSIASMAAAIMTMGGIKERQELYALYASGVSPWRITQPVIISAIVLFALSVFTSQYISPKAYHRLVGSIWEAKAGDGDIQIKSGHFLQSLEGVTIYASDDFPETGQLRDVLIYDRRSTDQKLPTVILARIAYLTLNQSQAFLCLYDGVRHVPDSADTYSRTYFDSLRFGMAVPSRPGAGAVPTSHRYFISQKELTKQIDSVKNNLIEVRESSPEWSEPIEKQYARSLYELHRRWSMSVNTVLFLFIGWFIGVKIGKGGLAVAGLIALGITIFSALLLEQGKSLAKNLTASPEFGAWLPVLGLGGLGLMMVLMSILRK